MKGLLRGAFGFLVLLAPGGSKAELRPPRELESLWADLGTDDPAKAHRAITALVAMPAQTVPFLQQRLRPVPAADPRRLTRLIADLDSSRFSVRQKAAQELEWLGEPAGPSLRQALQGRPSSEVRRRIEQILETHKVQRLHPPPGQRRLSRAVEVLEQIGNPGARRLLADLARGAPEATFTRDARGALDRLSERLGVPPSHTCSCGARP